MITPLFIPRFGITVATQALSSAAHKVAGIYVAPKTGNIRYIGCNCTAVSGSPALDLRIETLTSGLPSGTLFGTNTNASYSPTVTSSLVWTQLTADAAVTAGNTFAAVVAYTSGTSATVAIRMQNGWGQNQPCCAVTTGSWARQNDPPIVSVKYDDGQIISGATPVNSVDFATLTSSSTPNERATVFTAPVDCNCIGAIWMGTYNPGANYTANLYTGTSTTADHSQAVTSLDIGTGVSQDNEVYFSSAIALSAGQTYRISVKATTANSVFPWRATFASTNERNYTYGEITSDTRKDSSWIGESTTTVEMIAPLLDDFASGGGRRNRGRYIGI